MSKTLTPKALQDAAKELGIELAAIRAVDEIESRGEGFTDDGHVKILFERHKFHQFTHGKYDAEHPDISNAEAGGYGRGSQYARFSRAFELDPEAAMKSASWGRYQIMGFNFKAAGFNTVGEFVDAMKVSEDEHLKAFVKVIKAWGLAPELKAKDWAAFASQYNGADYRKNKYDTKLAAAYEKFREQGFTEPVIEPENGIVTGDNGDARKRPPDPAGSSKKPKDNGEEQTPQPPAAPQPTQKPEVLPVEKPKGSILTKIAAAASAMGPVIGATGLKIGGVEFKTGGLIAFAAVLIVGMVLAAWLYNEDRKRRREEQKESMLNLADPNRANIVAAGSKI